MSGNLPDSAAERNEYPLADGLLYYFPAALAAVARVSKIGNDQHNPGQPMHWARGKSTDHANKILRHQLDAGTLDSDGTRHSAKVAWRALAQLQEELEREEGAPLPRNARLPNPAAIREANIAYDMVCERTALHEVNRSAMHRHPAGIGDVAWEWPTPQRLEVERVPKWDPRWVEACPQLAHPMHAETIRDHDERLAGGEDRL